MGIVWPVSAPFNPDPSTSAHAHTHAHVYLFIREGIAILAYGVLAGGFLTDRWLGQPRPQWPQEPLPNRSLVKYLLVIDAWGGWAKFQGLLAACRAVADRHAARGGRVVTVAMVAIAYVLALPGVAAVILGAYLLRAK